MNKTLWFLPILFTNKYTRTYVSDKSDLSSNLWSYSPEHVFLQYTDGHNYVDLRWTPFTSIQALSSEFLTQALPYGGLLQYQFAIILRFTVNLVTLDHSGVTHVHNQLYGHANISHTL